MPEAILGLVIVALLVERYFADRNHQRETQRLVNAVLAKTPGELALLNREMESVPVSPRPEPSSIDGFEGQAGLS